MMKHAFKATAFTKISIFLLSLAFWGCKKNGKLERGQDSSSIASGIYQGYPSYEKTCDYCSDEIFRAISLSEGMLCFQNAEHFLRVRNCLADRQESYMELLESQGVEIPEDDPEDHEHYALREFEIWYPGFFSLRREWAQKESEWLASGADVHSMPEVPSVLDEVEQTLINREGKVKIGEQIINVFEKSLGGGSCVLAHVKKSIPIYTGNSNYYFIGRHSIFNWPWGATVYASTISLKLQGSSFTQVKNEIAVQGGGMIYKYPGCYEKHTFSIFNSGLKKRKKITRSYTLYGHQAGFKQYEECFGSWHFWKQLYWGPLVTF